MLTVGLNFNLFCLLKHFYAIGRFHKYKQTSLKFAFEKSGWPVSAFLQ